MVKLDMQIQCPHCRGPAPVWSFGDGFFSNHCGAIIYNSKKAPPEDMRYVPVHEQEDESWENPYLLHGKELERAVQAKIRGEI
ncbi:hypothetical protein ES708_03958 [subsurface metagenome]